ncbi:MAG: hypothetical protein ACJAYJ_000922 [Saprospiraceae bacterium]
MKWFIFAFYKGSLRDKNDFCKTVFIPQDQTRAAAGSAHCVF